MQHKSKTYSKHYNDPFPVALRFLCNNSKDVRDLASFLGCSTQAITQYKLGQALPKIENLIKIAHYYDCSLDYLIGLSDVKSIRIGGKKGKLIKHEKGFWQYTNSKGERDGWTPSYECSECGSDGWQHPEIMRFCPVCGVPLEEWKEEE